MCRVNKLSIEDQAKGLTFKHGLGIYIKKLAPLYIIRRNLFRHANG